MSKELIRLRDLCMAFDDELVLDHINLYINDSEFLTLLGPSGCGKTTTVRLLLGLLRAQKGQARLLGQDSAHLTTPTRERIGYMPQHFVLYPDLTVNENLRFAASLYGISIFKRGRLIQGASWVAGILAKEPPNLPTAVRTAETITMSSIADEPF